MTDAAAAEALRAQIFSRGSALASRDGNSSSLGGAIQQHSRGIDAHVLRNSSPGPYSGGFNDSVSSLNFSNAAAAAAGGTHSDQSFRSPRQQKLEIFQSDWPTFSIALFFSAQFYE
eukprot:COSAG05_NODE_1382_length_5019_cov_58.408740_1_plen_116_part_00